MSRAAGSKNGVVTMLDLQCENCGVKFQRQKRGKIREHTFCSQACYLKSDFHSQKVSERNYERNPDARQIRPCGTCGVPVERYVSTGQKQFFCSRACRWENHKHGRQINSGGYALIFIGRGEPGADKSGHILEHRKVMQDILGRPLEAHENVHHINGVRDDNRPENLELWSTSQPMGQRVEDKVEWCRWFLAQYAGADVSLG